MTSLDSLWQRVRALAQHDRVVLPVLLAVLAVYLGARHTHGMIPHDEGVLAQTAERVLNGEWPHRDFDDPYTGGLALLHAAAMRVFGVDLLAMRRVLLFASLCLSAVLYRLARRAVSPGLAAFVTCCAMAWATPNYFAALPSWYNLITAAAALLCVLRVAERDRATDVVLAGVFGGLSLLVKVVGVFHIAAGLLCLAFIELTRAAPVSNVRAARFAHGFVRVGACAFVVGLAMVLPASASPMDRLHFTLPGWLLAGVLILEDVRAERRGHALRLRPMFAKLSLYLAGVALPVALFVWPYVKSDSVQLLVYDVFIAPQRRIAAVSFSLPELWTLVWAAPMCVLLLAPNAAARSISRAPLLWLLLALLTLVLCFGSRQDVHTAVWMSLRPLVPIATLACALMSIQRADSLDPLRRTQLFCVLASTALASLVQFPYAFGVYFLYVAPLLVLALVFIAANQQPAPRRLWFAAACFHFGFALLWVNTAYVQTLGMHYMRNPPGAWLKLPRGGLYVPSAYAEAYTNLVQVIERHSARDAYIYASPDCPEVYFLSGRKNPTRTFFDLFDRDFTDPPATRLGRILDTLERHHVDVAVLCRFPEFSGRLPRATLERLEQRYPRLVDVPPLFSVRFRDPAQPDADPQR